MANEDHNFSSHPTEDRNEVPTRLTSNLVSLISSNLDKGNSVAAAAAKQQSDSSDPIAEGSDTSNMLGEEEFSLSPPNPKVHEYDTFISNLASCSPPPSLQQ